MSDTTNPQDDDGHEIRPGKWLRSPSGAMIGYEAATGGGIARLTFVWPDGREQSVRLSFNARNVLRQLLGPKEMIWLEDKS